MSAVSNLGAACGCERRRLPVGGKGPGTASPGSVDRRAAALRVAWRRQDGAYTVQLSPSNSRMKALASRSRFCTRMALVDEKIFHNPDSAKSSGVLSYDLIQGDLVKWNSFMDKSVHDPPTAVLLHGILGGRKNWGSFARRLAQEFPMWQFLLVDLRCHGDSTSIKKRGPHTVASAALDVLKLVGQLRVTPRVLVGHSFGGKVALSMVEQAAKPLARPVKVWVLDATPGKLRPGGDGEDHPGELIEFISSMPTEVSSKQEIISTLVEKGFSLDVARESETKKPVVAFIAGLTTPPGRRMGHAGGSMGVLNLRMDLSVGDRNMVTIAGFPKRDAFSPLPKSVSPSPTPRQEAEDHQTQDLQPQECVEVHPKPASVCPAQADASKTAAKEEEEKAREKEMNYLIKGGCSGVIQSRFFAQC